MRLHASLLSQSSLGKCLICQLRGYRRFVFLVTGSTNMSLRPLILCTAALWLTGCATSYDLYDARAQFASGAPVQALTTLENADVSGRDALLLLLDKGAIAFSAGQYSQAKDALLQAHDLIEEWDQIRVGEQSATLVTSEWATRYRGEYSEQLWIHSYLMMTFLMLGEPSSAAVEARRALARMDEHESSLKQDWFTRALIALSFEAAGAHDSAQVEYRKLVNDSHYNGQWNQVIQRHSRRIGRAPIDGITSADLPTPNQLGNDEGELIVFVQSGYIDKKQPGDLPIDIDLRIAYPFYPVQNHWKPSLDVLADGKRVAADRIDTPLTDVSKRSLSARGTVLATKQIARIAAKKALVDAAAKEDDVLGGVVQILMFATEQADTRSWETLPAWFSLIRVPLVEGPQTVSLRIQHEGVDKLIELGNFDIQAGQLHFATYRTTQPLPLRDGYFLETLTQPNTEPFELEPTLETLPEQLPET